MSYLFRKAVLTLLDKTVRFDVRETFHPEKSSRYKSAIDDCVNNKKIDNFYQLKRCKSKSPFIKLVRLE